MKNYKACRNGGNHDGRNRKKTKDPNVQSLNNIPTNNKPLKPTDKISKEYIRLLTFAG